MLIHRCKDLSLNLFEILLLEISEFNFGQKVGHEALHLDFFLNDLECEGVVVQNSKISCALEENFG